MEILQFIVAIAVPTTDGKHEVGTGCSVSNELVLTARHVVFPKNRDFTRAIVVYFGAAHGTKIGDCTTVDPAVNGRTEGCIKVNLELECIAWDGEESLDAVLIWCPRPDGWKGPPVSWAPTTESREWRSRGYPQAAITETAPLVPSGFGGNLEPTLKEDCFAESTVTTSPSAINGWRGASGMPLFCASSSAILGLAYEVPAGFGGKKINVVPTWKLFTDDKFKACVQKDDEAFQKFRTKMKERIANILQGQGSEAVAEALAQCYDVNRSNKGERANAIADRIVNSEPDELLTHLYKIQYGEPGRPGLTGNADLKAITDIMHVALPIFDDANIRQAAREIKSTGDATLVTLSVATRTVAEIAMALADGKESSFTYVPPGEGHVPGVFALEQLPVAGRDHEGMQAKWDFIKTLSALLQNGKHDEFKRKVETFIDETCISGNSRETYEGASHEERVQEIKAVLKMAWRNKGRRYYYVAQLPENDQQREAAKATLNALKEIYSPYIVFLALTNNRTTHSRETSRYGNVANLRRITP